MNATKPNPHNISNYILKEGINISKSLPLYYKVYNILRNKIEEEEYEKGELLPTEPELQKQFGVSRVTVRKALEMLANEGFIMAKQGKGTVVLDPKTTQKLNLVTSLTETLIEKGYDVSSKNVQIEYLKAPSYIYSELGLESNIDLVRVYRIRYANDNPIAITINYLLPELVPGIEQKKNKINSLYHLLETEYCIKIDSAIEKISSVIAGVTEAEILQIPYGTSLLTSKRVVYSENRPIGVDITSIIANKYEYSVYLKGRP